MPDACKTALKFVVLRHEGIPAPHFDFMFETAPGSALATWRFPSWPASAAVVATRLADHRRRYLDFEGEVSGDRGTVKRISSGTCELISKTGVSTELLLDDSLVTVHLVLKLIRADEWEARAL